MKYFSTRNKNELKSFGDIVIAGTAPDGGLYLPESIPTVDFKKLENLPYDEFAAEILSLFIDEFSKDQMIQICKKAYSVFKNDIVPLKKLEDNLFDLQLFQGPSLAFKDYAMCFLGVISDEVLKKKNVQKHIVTATSGDTGPAAMYGFKDSQNVKVTVYYPRNGVSEFQRNQLTSLKTDRIEAIPMDVDFDACQKIVKELLANDKNGEFMTVNSINIGRVLAQVVYYIWSFVKIGYKPCSFYVPTGNFGNICAAHIARTMGIDCELYLCVNDNDTFYRFSQTGLFEPKATIKTFANSMDIQNASNFERALYYISGDVNEVVKLQSDLKSKGHYQVDEKFLAEFKKQYHVVRVLNSDILPIQREFSSKYQFEICPHTAVAFGAFCKDNISSRISIIISTADPIKFKA